MWMFECGDGLSFLPKLLCVNLREMQYFDCRLLGNDLYVLP